MGMSGTGRILDRDMKGSLNMVASQPTFLATTMNDLKRTKESWCAKEADRNQFLEIDLKQARKVTGDDIHQ